jgi:AraC-like DNA-binding protein
MPLLAGSRSVRDHAERRERKVALHDERIALGLLANTMPLSEIALVTGFAEQSHFSRVFKNVVGASPRAWQRDPSSRRRKYSRRTVATQGQETAYGRCARRT